MSNKLISFDLRGDFGVFKKPDVNDGLQLTFNMLHKPALLGILGAILGLKGYQQKGVFPEYYTVLKDLPIGIEPLEGWHEQGNFSKTVIKYTNTVGYANADGNLLVTEQTLRSPAYRCYLLLDLNEAIQDALFQAIKKGEAVFLPYFGKNECAAWWDSAAVREYEFNTTAPQQSFSISSIFLKGPRSVREDRDDALKPFDLLEATIEPNRFIYLERVPLGFDAQLFQYQLGHFAYTNFKLKASAALDQLYHLPKEGKYVQLF